MPEEKPVKGPKTGSIYDTSSFGSLFINDNKERFLNELFELLTLRQTGMKRDIPIILFGREYWSKVINFELLADYGLVAEEDLSLFQYADTASEAWEIIRPD